MNSVTRIPCPHFLHIPHALRSIIATLQSNGFSAYLVGGCVRDGLLGKAIKDYDIATSATPQQILDIFAHSTFSPLPIGIKFGTIALYHRQSKQQYEVTTFRTDGAYNDNRKPDSVHFINDLEGDLLRRDFSINALACEVNDKDCCIIDYVGGLKDLKRRKIACVGNPDVRFCEDSLRILRALRFSATLGFEITKCTHNAIMRNMQLLSNLSAQRIASELDKMLVGRNFVSVFKKYSAIFVYIFTQYCQSGAIKNDSIKTICKDLSRFNGLKQEILLFARWACVLALIERHQSGRAGQVLENLKYSNAFIKKLTLFVRFYEVDLGIKKQSKLRIVLKQILREMGDKTGSEFITIKMCLMKKKHAISVKTALSVALKECFSLQGLCINGDDLRALGLNGKQIGEVLEMLLQEVICEKCVNKKKVLRLRAKKVTKKMVNTTGFEPATPTMSR